MASEPNELPALREGIAEVVASECSSRALHDYVDGKNDLESSLWRQAADLGWLGIGISEASGGLGLGAAGLAVLHEELGRRIAPGPYIATLAAAQWIEIQGDAAAKSRTLDAILAGELQIAIPAVIDSSGGGLALESGALRGRVRSLLGSTGARLALVPAGDAWMLIDIDGRTARLSARRPWDPTRTLVDLECEGATPLFTSRAPDATRRLARELSLAVIADSVGAAGTIYLQTVEYLKTRMQFDRPLASFQALKHRAADLKIAHDTSRHVAAQAFASVAGPDADLWAGLAKASVTDAFVSIAADCLQLHGGVGFTWAFDCHLYLKRARLNQALAGTNTSQTDAAFDALVRAMKENRSTLEIEL